MVSSTELSSPLSPVCEEPPPKSMKSPPKPTMPPSISSASSTMITLSLGSTCPSHTWRAPKRKSGSLHARLPRSFVFWAML